MKFTATYEGQTFTRTSKTRTYTHVALVKHPETGEIFDYRWSQTEDNAAKRLPYGWEAHRVAVVPCYAEGQEPEAVVEETPAEEPVEVQVDVTEPGRGIVHFPNHQALMGREDGRTYVEDAYSDRMHTTRNKDRRRAVEAMARHLGYGKVRVVFVEEWRAA
ncbi:hypothetical protein ACWGH5_09715 [Streptomyces sp. NPDC054864]